MKNQKRRTFLKKSGKLVAASAVTPMIFSSCAQSSTAPATEKIPVKPMEEKLFFDISLAQWSLNKAFFGGELDHLDFAKKARGFGINAIEYVNQFFSDKAEDKSYLKEMNNRAKGEGVKQLIIMVDREGGLGDVDDAARKTAVENHYKWVEAAKFLGCHSIRVNAYGEGSSEEVAKAAVDGLSALSTYAKQDNINVIVENHGGYSSNGSWLSGVMREVNMENCGTLPDFGNFCIKRGEGWTCDEEYDRYRGVTQMMPFAKAVSAKAHDFDEKGNEKHTDFLRMMGIVRSFGYEGYVGIEYEGNEMAPDQGIIATKNLLEKVGKILAKS